MDRSVFPIREVKFAGGDTMTFTGYGAVFGNMDSYGDVINPGAFADTLAAAQKSDQWPSMLLQHGGMGVTADDMTPIGVWTSLAEDGVGLKVEGKLADTQRGRDAYTLLKMDPRPAINGLSIGYYAKEYTNRSSPEEPRRTLKKVDLVEVSLVTFPANKKARVEQVKAIEGISTLADAERVLRDAGFSKAEALAFVSQIKNVVRSDSAPGDRSDSGFAEAIAALNRAAAVLNPQR